MILTLPKTQLRNLFTKRSTHFKPCIDFNLISLEEKVYKVNLTVAKISQGKLIVYFKSCLTEESHSIDSMRK